MMFLLVFLTKKVWPWELQKVQYERDSWEDPKNKLYNLGELMKRVFMQSVRVQQAGANEWSAG